MYTNIESRHLVLVEWKPSSRSLLVVQTAFWGPSTFYNSINLLYVICFLKVGIPCWGVFIVNMFHTVRRHFAFLSLCILLLIDWQCFCPSSFYSSLFVKWVLRLSLCFWQVTLQRASKCKHKITTLKDHYFILVIMCLPLRETYIFFAPCMSVRPYTWEWR